MSTTTLTMPMLGDAGTDENPIHIRVPGTQRSYCGLALGTVSGFIPEAEVTPSAWCVACERAWEQDA